MDNFNTSSFDIYKDISARFGTGRDCLVVNTTVNFDCKISISVCFTISR